MLEGRTMVTGRRGFWHHAEESECNPVDGPAFEPDPDYIITTAIQPIFDWIEDDSGHAVIEAGAGTGKTEFLVQAMHRMISQGARSIRVLAFNTIIADEIADRVDPSIIEALTFHKWGSKMLRQRFPRIKMDVTGDKLGGMVEAKCPDPQKIENKDDRSEAYRQRTEVKSCVSKMKATLASAASCRTTFGLELDENYLRIAEEIYADCYYRTERMDFDDMIWLPVQHKLRDKEKVDWLLIDETQDLNPVMVELAMRNIAPHTRCIWVGDRNQSIYAFRGADPHMMDLMIGRLKAETFSMPDTWRCPVSHVELINKIFPHVPFNAARDAQGEIIEIKEAELLELLTPEHTVISRMNAPLVKTAYQLLSAGRPATMKGRDLGSGLKAAVKATKAKDLGSALRGMSEAHERFATRLMKRGSERAEIIIAASADKVECVGIIIKGMLDGLNSGRLIELTVEGLLSEIDRLTAPSGEGVTLSSIHRIKGCTVKHAVILDYNNLPYGRKDPDDAQQEMNCLYVAMSRSNDKLTLVYTENKK